MRQAAILAGGLGTRLRGVLAADTPKPMAQVAGQPFLEIVLRQLAEAGFDEAVLLLGHRSSVIQDHFGESFEDVRLVYAVEPQPLGTGGALKHAQHLLAEQFLVLNGDTYLAVDYNALFSALDDRTMVMALARVDDVGRFGAVQVEGTVVTQLLEKTVGGPGLINGGVYALRREVLDLLPDGRSSFEKDVLETQLGSLRPNCVIATGQFFDIGVPSDLEAADRYFASSL